MHILFISSEVAPFSSTGDLGEWCGTFPRALREIDHQVTVVTPFYSNISPEKYGLARRIRTLDFKVGNEAVQVGLYDGKFINSDVSVIFIDHPPSFQRTHYYGSPGETYPDNYKRFYILSYSALELVSNLGLNVDLIHANDWQTGFLPYLARTKFSTLKESANILFTVHDPAYAGLFPASVLDDLCLGYDHYNPEGIEFHGQVSLLKAGLLGADCITTMSPTYGRELLTQEYGFGFEGVFQAQKDKLFGVLPGIDPSAWNPSQNHRIAETYSVDTPAGKESCKKELQTALGFAPRTDIPLVVMVGPFREDKGINVLLDALPQLPSQSLQIACFGPAPLEFISRFERFSNQAHMRASYQPTLDHDLLHRILSGADALLIPSLYEPGGLLQLKAMRFGTIPIVHAVGGLRDSVVDFDERTESGTGICFNQVNADSLRQTLQRFLSLYKNKVAWTALIKNAMRQNITMLQAGKRYQDLYTLIPKRKSDGQTHYF